jgi:MFS family permease
MTSVPQQRWVRIIPVATVMYAVAFINRTNISLALPAMSRSLQMNSVQGGMVVGIFFWGYLLLQLPGGYLATLWSTKRFVSILLLVWGCCAVGCGLVRTWQQLWLMRLLLGVAEGGMYPATLVLLSRWFPQRERARANALFSLALPLSLVASSPLTGWMLDRWNWRVMLIVEGTFPLVWLIVWIFGIYDHPGQAPWVSEEERQYLEVTFRAENLAAERGGSETYWRALLVPQTFLLSAVKLLMLTAQLGYLFWLPSAIEKTAGINNFKAGVLFTIPFFIGAVSLVMVSSHSDKLRERRAHIAVPLAVGGLALLGGALTIGRWPVLAFALVCLAAIGAFAPLGPFWSIPTEWFSRKIGGSVAGFVNGVGNLGGFFGPLLVGYLNKRTGNFTYGFGVLGIFMLVGAALSLKLRPTAPLTPRTVRVSVSSPTSWRPDGPL